MNKKKIIILAISAAVVIAGAIAAVVLLRDFNVKEDTTTTATTAQQYVEQTYFVDVPEYVTNEANNQRYHVGYCRYPKPGSANNTEFMCLMFYLSCFCICRCSNEFVLAYI